MHIEWYNIGQHVQNAAALERTIAALLNKKCSMAFFHVCLFLIYCGMH